MSGSGSTVGKTQYILYHYVPSLPTASIFTSLFVLLGLYHTYKLIRTRSWFFIPFAIGCYCEAIGYVFRILSHHNNTDTVPYILQAIFLLVAPTLFAATIYMSLSRLLFATDFPNILDPFPVKWTTRFLVMGDILCSIGQGTGGGLLAVAAFKDKPSFNSIGKGIIMAGLGIQLVFLAGFIAMVLFCRMRLRRITKPISSQSGEPEQSGDNSYHPSPESMLERCKTTNKVIILLAGTSLMILNRGMFRTMEYAQGQNGFFMSKEVFLYLGDGILMLIVAIAMAVWYPPNMWSSEKTRIRKEDQ